MFIIQQEFQADTVPLFPLNKGLPTPYDHESTPFFSHLCQFFFIAFLMIIYINKKLSLTIFYEFQKHFSNHIFFYLILFSSYFNIHKTISQTYSITQIANAIFCHSHLLLKQLNLSRNTIFQILFLIIHLKKINK